MSNVTEKEEALYVVRAARQELHRLAQKCMMFGADPTGLNQKMCDILEDTLQQLRRTEGRNQQRRRTGNTLLEIDEVDS